MDRAACTRCPRQRDVFYPWADLNRQKWIDWVGPSVTCGLVLSSLVWRPRPVKSSPPERVFSSSWTLRRPLTAVIQVQASLGEQRCLYRNCSTAPTSAINHTQARTNAHDYIVDRSIPSSNPHHNHLHAAGEPLFRKLQPCPTTIPRRPPPRRNRPQRRRPRRGQHYSYPLSSRRD
jgi:hypothetical protein